MKNLAGRQWSRNVWASTPRRCGMRALSRNGGEWAQALLRLALAAVLVLAYAAAPWQRAVAATQVSQPAYSVAANEEPEPTPDPEPDPEPGPNPDNPDPGPDPDKPEETVLLALSLDAYKTDAYSQFLEHIGVTYNQDADEWRVPQTLGSPDVGQRLRLAAQATWSDGSEYSQVKGEWKTLEVTWETSDAQVATVDNLGVVTAVGEGSVVITAKGGGVSAKVGIDVMGSGPYVTRLVVIDEEGNPYGDTRITFDKIDGASSKQLYARVTYSDGATSSTLPGAQDYQARDMSSIRWSVTSTDAGYVNEATGNFKPLADGMLSVVAEIAGGDSNENAGRVSGSVWVKIDTGRYGDGNPSDHLTVRVVYSDDESRVFEERTFSIAELRSMETAYATYTLTKSNGSYVTDSAQGIYLTTLFSAVGVSLDKVSHLRFSSTDNYASDGSITASALFMSRYYFPMYEFGRNPFGSTLVYPMLAYADSWREGGSCDADYSSLNSNTCLRLLFGSVGESDNWTGKSFKYVNGMTIVLTGKPPAQNPIEDPDDGPPGTGGNDDMNTAIAGLGESDAPLSSQLLSSSGGDGDADSENAKKEQKFQVFQMLSKDDYQVGSYDLGNPLIPFFLPALLLVALAGAGATVTHYRKELA